MSSGVYSRVAKSRWRRVALWTAVVLLSLIVVFLATVQVYQRSKRRQAERLLAEISNLELRRATFDDAQKLADEWTRYLTVSNGCNRQKCDYTFEIENFTKMYPRWWLWEPLLKAGLRIGIRPAIVVATLRVRDGLIWGKSFDLVVGVSNLSDPDAWPYMLMASTRTVSRFDSFYRADAQLELHKNYQIGRPGGCEGCLFGYVNFTPYANPADIRRLMQINLDCLTRWHPCQDQADILPNAWKQKLEEQAFVDAQYEKHELNCNAELAGRDLPNAVIAEVLEIAKDPDNQNGLRIQARLVRALKGAAFWKVGTEEQLDMDTVWCPEPGLKLRKGMKAIFLLHDRSQTDGNAPLDVAACGIYAASDENLAKIQKGIDQDFLAGETEKEQLAWRD